MIKKIVLIGPESTGKSTLGEQLASHYNTLCCPEYAREYLLAKEIKYNYEDLLDIAKGQLAMEDEYCARLEAIAPGSGSAMPFFIDTDMYVMKVWCEYLFGKCHRFILDQIIQRKYDLYLLCKDDLPWTEDPLREYPAPEKRAHLFLHYKDILMNQSVPWTGISGNFEKRLDQAIRAVDKLLLE
jgi:NadR type nicotinamide-nucleotide adenylyltransferase